MGWPTYLYNITREDLVKIANHWKVAFDPNATVKDLIVLLKTHAATQSKTENDLPDDVDKDRLIYFRGRSPSPSTKPPQQPLLQFPSTPGGSVTNQTVDPVDRLTTMLSNFISTVSQQQSSTSQLTNQLIGQLSQATAPASTSTSHSAVTTVIDRDRRVKNAEDECRKQDLIFNGLPAENVKLFLYKVDEVLKIYPLKDHEIARLLHSILGGPAKEHFKANDALYKDWSTAKQTLKDVFLPSTYDTGSKIALFSRRQKKNEPIAEFIADVKLLNECLITPCPSDEVIKIVQKNVHPDYYRDVRGKTFTDLDEIRKIGQELELMWFDRRNYRSEDATNPRVSSVEQPRGKERECYGCGARGKTLRDCTCDRALRYQARERTKSPVSSPIASPASKRKVTFARDRSQSPASRSRADSDHRSHAKTSYGNSARDRSKSPRRDSDSDSKDYCCEKRCALNKNRMPSNLGNQ